MCVPYSTCVSRDTTKRVVSNKKKKKICAQSEAQISRCKCPVNKLRIARSFGLAPDDRFSSPRVRRPLGSAIFLSPGPDENGRRRRRLDPAAFVEEADVDKRTRISIFSTPTARRGPSVRRTRHLRDGHWKFPLVVLHLPCT
ncbi:unnamed protein product [Ixodes pacificus]